jgi:hypothetical protein
MKLMKISFRIEHHIKISILFCFALFTIGNSQSELKIGEWATHLPFNSAKLTAVGNSYAYFATENAILKVAKSDYSAQKLTRTSGLSDSKIQTIYFHPATSSLIIAYNSSLIDIVSPSGVKSIADIVNFNNIPISKTIQSISYADDTHVYINADYGYSLLNLNTNSFEYSLFSKNLKYYNIDSDANFLYAATSGGVYRFQKNTNKIPQDFSAWELLGSNFGLPVREFKNIVNHYNHIYAASNDALFKLNDQGTFENLYSDSKYKIQYISAEKQNMYVGLTCFNNCNNKILKWEEDDIYTTIENDCTQKNMHVTEDSEGNLWLADERWGFRIIKPNSTTCDIIYSNGPLSTNFFEILPTKAGVYVTAGGYGGSYIPYYRADGVFKYYERNWSFINALSEPIFETEKLHDMLRLVEHPDGNLLYLSSYGRGLLEYNYEQKTYKHFDERNSKLGISVGDPTRVRVSGLDFNKSDKVLWATVFLAKEPIVSYDGNTWRSFSLPGAGTELIDIKVDQNGYKWIIPRGSTGVWVWDEKDPQNPNDDRSILLNSSNTVMPSSKVNCVQVDLEGDVWVGTLNGPIVFECGGDQLFSGQCKGSQRKVDQNGIIDLLLKTEEVISIAVDGGNRKWFGTRNGLYVMNAGGDVQVHLFTTKNSPLMSDVILDIAIDPTNGDAWIGTEQGLQVYRSEAISAENSFTTVPNIFPNPVEPNYTGPIAISGLSRDARVKITDVTGNLVHESTAIGGQLLWDGRDANGKQVKSGTYLVFANTTKNFETSDGIVSKLVIVR